MLLAELLRELGVPGVRLRLAASARPTPARAYLRRAARRTCARTRPSCPTDVRERIDAEPAARLRLRPRGHAGGDGGRAARCSTASTARTPSTSPRCAALLDARRRRVRARRRRWCAASTTTRARCSSSSRDALGAQSALGGGGRYDGLIEQLGGPPTPACGWAAGIERILLALDERRARRPPARRLRRRRRRPREPRAGARRSSCAARASRAELDLAGRSLKGQLKQADRLGARTRVILDDDGEAHAARHGDRRAARRSIRRRRGAALGASCSR